MSWTDERIEKLTKMWESGATASQIAEDLGGVSRNAVIGKAHRLGLKARPSPVKANERPDPVGHGAAIAETASEPAVSPPLAVPPEVAVVAATEPVAQQQPAPPPELPPIMRPVVAAPAAPVTTAVSPDGSQPIAPPPPRIVSVGPGGFLRQGPGDQQAPIPPAPPRRLVPAKPSPEIAAKTSLLDLKIGRA